MQFQNVPRHVRADQRSMLVINDAPQLSPPAKISNVRDSDSGRDALRLFGIAVRRPSSQLCCSQTA